MNFKQLCQFITDKIGYLEKDQAFEGNVGKIQGMIIILQHGVSVSDINAEDKLNLLRKLNNLLLDVIDTLEDL